MTFSQSLTTFFEILAVVAVIWCVFNEDRLVLFEQKLLSRIRRRRLRVVKSKKCVHYKSFS